MWEYSAVLLIKKAIINYCLKNDSETSLYYFYNHLIIIKKKEHR